VSVAPRRVAVVTGASSGIGLEIARGLARRGYDLLLVARRFDRLEALEDELERRHGIRVRARALDLSSPIGVDRLLAEIEDEKALEVLVNNAGFGVVGEFVATDAEAEERMIRLHVTSVVRVTKVVARRFAAAGSGYILNVASTAGFKPGPLGVVYAATKAFLISFSEGLGHELRASGVTVTTCCPGPTRTEFDAVAAGAAAADLAGARGMAASDVAERGLEALFARKSVVIPGAANRLHVLAARLLPAGFLAWLTRAVRARRRGRRRRAEATRNAGRLEESERVPLAAVPFAGLTFHTGEFERTADWLAAEVAAKGAVPRVVAHVNAHNYHRMFHGPGAAEALDGRTVLLFDGIGMKLAAWLMHGTWHPDLNGTDLFPRLMRRLAEARLAVYFLGGSVPVVEEAVRRTQAAYPGLRVAGWSAGYFPESDERGIAEKVRASGADLLILARGSGLQREFLARNLVDLGVAVVWNAGGLFNFVSGEVPRAPKAVCALRLEWLFRLVREPGRMWRRNVVIGPWLIGLALKERWSRRASVEVVSWERRRIEE